MIYGAFQNCYMLTSVILPDGLTKIGEYAFFACYDLTTITIPSSVTNIKPLAFNGCHRLVEIYNQSSLLMEKGSNENGYIAYYAKNIYDVKGSSKLSTTDDGYVLYKEGDLVSVIAYFGPDTSLTLSSEITEINELAFYKCIGLTSITIPSSIKTINTQAFQECTALTSIIYQGTTAQWREMSRYSDWDLWTGNYVVHCTDGDISKE